MAPSRAGVRSSCRELMSMQGSTTVSSRLVIWGMDAWVSLPILASTKPTAIIRNMVPTWEATISRYSSIDFPSLSVKNPAHSITKPERKQAGRLFWAKSSD